MEFSKKIFLFVGLVALTTVIFSYSLMWITRDTSGLAYLIPAVFGELCVGTGFYFNKAKAENEIKIKMEYEKLGIKEESEVANG